MTPLSQRRRRRRTAIWRDDVLCTAAIWWPLLAAAILALSGLARADDDGEALALARVCASEAGLTCSEHECAAIAAVLRARPCRGCSLERRARLYSARAFDVGRRDPRAWIAHLDARGAEPRGWPAVASWRAHAPRWLALLDTARAIVRGEIAAQCAPEHWGARYGVDLERAQHARWVEVDCGVTRNAFYAVPRMTGGR